MTKQNKPRLWVRMFQKEFAPKILSGEKFTTIRPIPKIMPQVGDIQSNRVWAGKPYRSKQTVLNKVVLTEVRLVTIFRDRIVVKDAGQADEEVIALNDGFSNWDEMRRWFFGRYNLPRDFVLYGWGKAVQS